MSYSGSLAAILTHVTAAGAALTIAFTDVATGFPVPKGRCIRIFYGGEGDPTDVMGARRTMTTELIAELTVIEAYWPVSEMGESGASDIDAEMVTLKQEIKTRLYGDSQLGGQCTDLTIDDAQPDFPVIAGTKYRSLTLIVTSAYDEITVAA